MSNPLGDIKQMWLDKVLKQSNTISAYLLLVTYPFFKLSFY